METQTFKIDNFTITTNEYKEIISSTKPGLLEEIRRQMWEVEDDLYYIDHVNYQYFRFFSEDYGNIFSKDCIEKMRVKMDVWNAKDLDDRARSVLVCSCYEFEMRD